MSVLFHALPTSVRRTTPARLPRRPLTRLLAMLATLAFAAPAVAEDWQARDTAQARGQVSTWVRKVEGEPIHQFRGQVEVPHNAASVLAVLADLERADEWIYQCQRGERREAWGPDYGRLEFKGIWPASDRDVIIHSRIEQDAEGSILLTSRQAEGLLPKQKGFVRIPRLENSFLLQPLDDGWTRVTFTTLLNPGGAIPAWLANMVATRAPLDTLQGLSRQLQDPAYRISRLEDVPFRLSTTPDLTLPDAHLRNTPTSP